MICLDTCKIIISVNKVEWDTYFVWFCSSVYLKVVTTGEYGLWSRSLLIFWVRIFLDVVNGQRWTLMKSKAFLYAGLNSEKLRKFLSNKVLISMNFWGRFDSGRVHGESELISPGSQWVHIHNNDINICQMPHSARFPGISQMKIKLCWWSVWSALCFQVALFPQSVYMFGIQLTLLHK